MIKVYVLGSVFMQLIVLHYFFNLMFICGRAYWWLIFNKTRSSMNWISAQNKAPNLQRFNRLLGWLQPNLQIIKLIICCKEISDKRSWECWLSFSTTLFTLVRHLYFHWQAFLFSYSKMKTGICEVASFLFFQLFIIDAKGAHFADWNYFLFVLRVGHALKHPQCVIFIEQWLKKHEFASWNRTSGTYGSQFCGVTNLVVQNSGLFSVMKLHKDHTIKRDTYVNHYILPLKYLSNHINFIYSPKRPIQR